MLKLFLICSIVGSVFLMSVQNRPRCPHVQTLSRCSCCFDNGDNDVYLNCFAGNDKTAATWSRPVFGCLEEFIEQCLRKKSYHNINGDFQGIFTRSHQYFVGLGQGDFRTWFNIVKDNFVLGMPFHKRTDYNKQLIDDCIFRKIVINGQSNKYPMNIYHCQNKINGKLVICEHNWLPQGEL